MISYSSPPPTASPTGGPTRRAEIYRTVGAVRLDGLISTEVAAHLSDYTKLRVHNGAFTRSSTQVPGSFECYGDPAFDTLLGSLSQPISDAIGLSLRPTYSFVRVYHRGEDLKRHSDRPACEHSVTLHLASSGETSWPIAYRDLSGEERHEVLAVGDAVAYQGGELEHWRDPCPLEWFLQVFLHYVEATGPHAGETFDRRPYLGLPASTQRPA